MYLYLYLCICALWVVGKQDIGSPTQCIYPPSLVNWCLYFLSVSVSVFVFLCCGWVALLVLVFSICVCICICICALWVGCKQDKKRPTQSIYLLSLVTCFKPKALFWCQNSIFVICKASRNIDLNIKVEICWLLCWVWQVVNQKHIEKNLMMRRTGLSMKLHQVMKCNHF